MLHIKSKLTNTEFDVYYQELEGYPLKKFILRNLKDFVVYTIWIY